MTGPRSRLIRSRATGGLLAGLVALATLAVPTKAGAATGAITSTGPLTQIIVSDLLNCQVARQGDAELQFFSGGSENGACGTLVAVEGVLFGPAFLPAASATGLRVPFTPVSQSPVTGAGTAADPLTLTTIVDLGTTGLRLTQTDSYVVGEDSYRTDVQFANAGAAPQAVVLFRAGDCYLQGSDQGYGFVDPARKAVGCSATPNNSPSGRVIAWSPVTGGNNYSEGGHTTVWGQIGAKSPLPDTCECEIFQDNAAALSWSFALPPGGQEARSHLTTFSPAGQLPLATAKTADSPAVVAGEQDGYTITVSNPNPSPVVLDSVTDLLPAGFTYRTGTTTGATTADPAISGQTLHWTGPFTVPSSGSTSLHFGVNVATSSGQYFNNATADAAGSASVVSTGDTAPITVTAPPANVPPSVDAGLVVAGDEGALVSLRGTATDPDGPSLSTVWSYTVGAGVDPGATCTFASPGAVETTVSCTDDGTYTLALTATDGLNPPVSDSTLLTLANLAPSVAVAIPSADSKSPVGRAVELRAPFTDPGSNDTHTCDIQWGDGTSAQGTVGAGACSGTHAFAAPGTYTIVVRVSDDDGATGVAQVRVAVVSQVGVIVNGGGIVVDDGVTLFRFAVLADADGTHGILRFLSHHGRFQSSSIDSLSAVDRTVTWSGTGRWDDADGYTFVATAQDARIGRWHPWLFPRDRFSVSVRDSTGAVVFETSGVVWAGGIELRP